MLAKVFGSILHGVEAFRIMVEVNVGNGLGYHITGQPDEIVKESLGRAEVAIKGLNYQMPRTKLSVNLSPADIRKTGAGFDLPIALGILLASGQARDGALLRSFIVVGELGLDGTVLPVRGSLCMASQALADGMRGIILPLANLPEAGLVGGLNVLGVSHLRELLTFLAGKGSLRAAEKPTGSLLPDPREQPDFRDIPGQKRVKRALEIAAAGGHPILLYGSPGV